MKESCLYQKLTDNQVKCQTCAHRCLISPGRRGICGVRQNIEGRLFVLTDGRAIASHIDPIEKKPLFHFLPGSQSYSVAAVGCNLRCANCQNWEISQTSKEPQITAEEIEEMGFDLPPQKIVEEALASSCPSISYTYTEPTIFLEWALDTMKLAKKKGLKNVWVSNGFMTEETIILIAPYLDAANVDLKSFSEEFYQKNCGAKLVPILENLKLMKKMGMWLEITTLVIPTLSDSPEMLKQIARFIKKELGPETPWHVSAFSGEISWKLQQLPETPVSTLQKAAQIGLDAGLKYVYSGNVPGLASEDTYCPNCQTLNIDRTGYRVVRFDNEGKCYQCGQDLNLIL